jgi:hypothetical protein
LISFVLSPHKAGGCSVSASVSPYDMRAFTLHENSKLP